MPTVFGATCSNYNSDKAIQNTVVGYCPVLTSNRPRFIAGVPPRPPLSPRLVLQLQSSKLDLAAAIISQDNSVIRNLQREDLELLLS